MFSNCIEYDRVNSAIAFCVDIPTDSNESDYSYYYKLKEAVSARNQMLKLANHICPETNMGIVLQPRNPLEIENHFSMVATPRCSIYAYPASNKPIDALGNAYVLSFLHNVGVRYVHFLGSSAVPIITLLAQAIVLNLFDKCSFDSLTWNQPAVRQGNRFLNPETLKSLPKKPLHKNSNLRLALQRHEKFFHIFKNQFNPPQFMITKEWLGIVNIEAIKYFKNRVIDKLSKQKSLRKLFRNNKSFANFKSAVQLLNESKYLGHDFVKEKYSHVLNDLNHQRINKLNRNR